MRVRDRDDSSRPDSPLTRDGGYEVLESDGVAAEEIARRILARVEAGEPSGP
jgi:cytidylate kinase